MIDFARSAGLFIIGTLLLSCAGTRAFAPVSFRAMEGLRTCDEEPSTLRRQRRSFTALSVFERMSEDCIACLVTAQDLANRLEAESVSTECLLAGCIDRPTPPLRRTLRKYQMTFRSCQQAAQELSRKRGSEGNKQESESFLIRFRLRKQNEDRPFSDPAKKALQKAGRLANQRKESTIETHHLFLSLLGYNPNVDGESGSIENPESDAWAVIQQMLGSSDQNDDSPSAQEISNSLIQYMEENPQGDKLELVTGSLSPSKTPTLAECGVDLTEQARDGLLDTVHGRDVEIRACLRTLLRRRKNNVVLLGEPGVGSEFGALVFLPSGSSLERSRVLFFNLQKRR